MNYYLDRPENEHLRNYLDWVRYEFDKNRTSVQGKYSVPAVNLLITCKEVEFECKAVNPSDVEISLEKTRHCDDVRVDWLGSLENEPLALELAKPLTPMLLISHKEVESEWKGVNSIADEISLETINHCNDRVDCLGSFENDPVALRLAEPLTPVRILDRVVESVKPEYVVRYFARSKRPSWEARVSNRKSPIKRINGRVKSGGISSRLKYDKSALYGEIRLRNVVKQQRTELIADQSALEASGLAKQKLGSPALITVGNVYWPFDRG